MVSARLSAIARLRHQRRLLAATCLAAAGWSPSARSSGQGGRGSDRVSTARAVAPCVDGQTLPDRAKPLIEQRGNSRGALFVRRADPIRRFVWGLRSLEEPLAARARNNSQYEAAPCRVGASGTVASATLPRNTSPTSDPRRLLGPLSGGFLLATHNVGTVRPLKPHLTFQQQLQLLIGRGLAVDNPGEALATLERLGYYRLAGYFYPMRRTQPPGTPGRRDDFAASASLRLIVDLYEFDKQLRLLALDVAERLEVALRVCIAHDLGRLHPDAHSQRALFDQRFTAPGADGRSPFDRWHLKLAERKAAARDDFVQHHDMHYGGAMPIWVAVELWDFGMLSRFYTGMRFREKNRLAHRLGRLTAPQLQSWLRTLNFVRNVAAHHSRLWNRNVPEVPSLPQGSTHPLLAHLHVTPGITYRVYPRASE